MGVETYTRNESEVGLPIDTRPIVFVAAVQCGPILIACYGVETERTRWYPKDGELCLSRTKPEETLVEARRCADVQIAFRTWV
jgi:hypothetical protein